MNSLTKIISVITFFTAITVFVCFFPYRKSASTISPTYHDVDSDIGKSERMNKDIGGGCIEDDLCLSCTSWIPDTANDVKIDIPSEPTLNRQCEIESYTGDGFEIEVRDGKIYISVVDAKSKYYFRANVYLSNHGCKFNDENVIWE